jgi:hypothetical protein
MALFTDGTISTLEDLAAHDSSVLEVANTEGLDLTKKLELAKTELGIELSSMLPRLAPYDRQYSGTTARDLGSVTVTPALRLWHTFHTLELAYRDAFHNQLNDRYRERRDEYHELTKWAAEKLLQTGIGLVADPVARAMPPAIEAVNGSLAPALYFVTMCWVNGSGEEGASATVQGVTAAQGTGFAVRPGLAPGNAKGWNVFVGTASEEMRRQNPNLLSTRAEWMQTTAPAVDGPLPGDGQETAFLRPGPRIIQRG